MNIFLLSRSWHEQTIMIYRASGLKHFLCGHGKDRRGLSAENSMLMSFGYGCPARVQARTRAAGAGETTTCERAPLRPRGQANH